MRDGRRNAIIYENPLVKKTEETPQERLDFQIWKAELHRELQLFWETLEDEEDE